MAMFEEEQILVIVQQHSFPADIDIINEKLLLLVGVSPKDIKRPQAINAEKNTEFDDCSSPMD